VILYRYRQYACDYSVEEHALDDVDFETGSSYGLNDRIEPFGQFGNQDEADGK